VKFLTPWKGKKDKDSEKRSYKPGETEDVDMDTFKSLVARYNIAEAVPVEEIIKSAEEEKKPKKTEQRASKTRASKAKSDKMVKGAANK
jgi:hypothetical protein